MIVIVLAMDRRELSTHDDYIPSDSAPCPHKQTMPATPISHILSVARIGALWQGSILYSIVGW